MWFNTRAKSLQRLDVESNGLGLCVIVESCRAEVATKARLLKASKGQRRRVVVVAIYPLGTHTEFRGQSEKRQREETNKQL